jgi:glycosyltransferase involved in cell wall biosynthesis
MNLPADAVLVTKIARLAELKGHRYVLAAAERISDERVYFCFVGDGRLRGQIERGIASRGLAERFRLTGLVAPERIPAILHASDIVVHCSLREGLARALPQGLLAGKPVVSFDVDGAREVVDADTGILLAAGDVRGLALAIEALAESSALRDKLGAAGRQRCREMFDHTRMIDRIEAAYLSLTK